MGRELSGLWRRLGYLARVYLWTVLVFVAAKAAFMLVCREGHAFSGADVLQVAAHGLSLDLSTALYFLVVPFLATIASLWVRVPHGLLRGYFLFISVAFSLAFVADVSLYPFWGFKLDATCLQYLETPGEAAASVSGGYLAVRLLALVAVAALVYWGYPAEPPRAAKATGWRRGAELALYLLLTPAMVVGMRGGLDESTTNVGQVYYSQDQFLNHAAVNPVFSFLASLERSTNQLVSYHFFDRETAQRLVDGLYGVDSLEPDTLLNTQRPNVVVVLLESCGAMFAEVMPRLSALADEGVAFTNCYGNSYRTDRGTVCALSGYPAFPTMSVMKMPAKTRTLPSLAASLKREGYATSYLYGGDINFTNMRSYLLSTGYERLTWKADYSRQEQQTAEWGVRDDITFATLASRILEADTAQAPYFITFSTLSSHEPWDVPVKRYDDKRLNAFHYLDCCIGQLVDTLRQSPQWRKLLLVFVPDHSMNYRDYDEQHPDRNRIPLVWAGGAVKQPRRLEAICNQTDLCATLLGQMGLDHGDFTYSRDVASRSYRYPFAIHMFNNGFSLVDSTGFVAYDLTANRVTTDRSRATARLVETGKAILQLTADDLNDR